MQDKVACHEWKKANEKYAKMRECNEALEEREAFFYSFKNKLFIKIC
jgi:hypothetical protein